MIKVTDIRSLPRFYVKPGEEDPQELLIEGEESRHLRLVLRLKKGDVIATFDGRGNSYKAEIQEIFQDRVRAKILESRRGERESPLTLHLVQALLRAEKMDWVVQKATELGVSRITPLLTRRSLVRFSSKDMSSKQERWQKIAKEACKQCGRSYLPQVEPPVRWERWIEGPFDPAPRFFFYESEKEKKLKPLQEKFTGTPSALLALGPEGGWEPGETATLEKQGFLSLSLGPRILRAETATLAAITLIQYLWGDLS